MQYVALLRAINVGGQRKVAMSDLSNFVAGLGLTHARTLLQSGNVVFSNGEKTPPELERSLEIEAIKQLDLRTDILVRAANEWPPIIDHNPFPELAERDPSHLVVMFLKEAPSDAAVEKVQAAITGSEDVGVYGRQLYIAYRAGIGRSPLTNSLLESKLGTRGTGRNWNTVLKLAELLRD